jgi:hypothetical protein
MCYRDRAMSTKAIESIEPPDCYLRAVQLTAAVERIRFAMGRPVDRRPAVTVSGASPRECWFQALAVFRKADRLCQELAGDPLATIPHAPPMNAIRPGHVLAVIDAAIRELDEVQRVLGIEARGDDAPRDSARTPSDVFGALATANRQINLLLERPFSPADVYQQVSLAISYLARVENVEPPPASPFVVGKRPADCYDRLLGCVPMLRRAIEATGQPVIDRTPQAGDAETVLPSDVYDLATLVLGEAVFLHAQRPDANPPYPFEGHASGRKLPSHVWQLVGVLEQQLQRLAR